MAGLRGFAMGAIFYLGAGWPQWKPLDTPGSWLKGFQTSSILIFLLSETKENQN